MYLWKQEGPETFENIRDFYWQLIDDIADHSEEIGWKKGIYPSDEFLKDSLSKGELYTLRDERKIIGSVILNSAYNEGYEGLPWSKKWRDGEVLIPHALAVTPRLQHQGIGKLLMDHVLETVREKKKKGMRLDILGTNRPAEALYRGRGFRFVASRTMYYPDTGWADYWMFELNF